MAPAYDPAELTARSYMSLADAPESTRAANSGSADFPANAVLLSSVSWKPDAARAAARCSSTVPPAAWTAPAAAISADDDSAVSPAASIASTPAVTVALGPDGCSSTPTSAVSVSTTAAVCAACLASAAACLTASASVAACAVA